MWVRVAYKMRVGSLRFFLAYASIQSSAKEEWFPDESLLGGRGDVGERQLSTSANRPQISESDFP